MLVRLVTERILWSPCPSTGTLKKLAREGLGLIVNLSYECRGYQPPEGVEVLEYPIPDFYFNPPEDVAFNVLEPVRRWLEESDRSVLVHCVGGIGRSGTLVAMLLVYALGYDADGALDRVEELGGGPESHVQLNSFRWLVRNLSLLGRNGLLAVYREGRRYDFGAGIRHASTVANIAVDVLEALRPTLGLKTDTITAAYVAGMMHDIGRSRTSNGHHGAGAELVLKMRILRELADLRLVSRLVYHHRRHTDPLSDKELARWGEDAVIAAAAIRLADAFYDAYGFEEAYSQVEAVEGRLVVRGVPLSAKRLQEKAELLEKVTGLKVEYTIP